MLLYGVINLFHQTDGFVQSNDYLLVVGNIFRGENPPLTVLEPFLTNPADHDLHYRWLLRSQTNK